jgi:hypothetical protein
MSLLVYDALMVACTTTEGKMDITKHFFTDYRAAFAFYAANKDRATFRTGIPDYSWIVTIYN